MHVSGILDRAGDIGFGQKAVTTSASVSRLLTAGPSVSIQFACASIEGSAEEHFHATHFDQRSPYAHLDQKPFNLEILWQPKKRRPAQTPPRAHNRHRLIGRKPLPGTSDGMLDAVRWHAIRRQLEQLDNRQLVRAYNRQVYTDNT